MNRFKKILWVLAAWLGVAVSQPGALRACTTCYGGGDSSAMSQGMSWGIFSLLCIIMSVLGGIGMFFVHVGRRSASLPVAENKNSPSLKD